MQYTNYSLCLQNGYNKCNNESAKNPFQSHITMPMNLFERSNEYAIITEKTLSIYSDLNTIYEEITELRSTKSNKTQVYRIEAELWKKIVYLINKKCPRELLRYFKSPLFTPTHTLEIATEQWNEIYTTVIRLFYHLRSSTHSGTSRLNNALRNLLFSLEDFRHSLITIASELNQIESQNEGLEEFRTQFQDYTMQCLEEEGLQHALNSSIGFIKLLNRIQSIAILNKHTPYMQLRYSAASIRALQDLCPMLRNPVINFVRVVHETSVLQFPALALEIGSLSIHLNRSIYNAYKLYPLLKNPLSHILNNYVQFLPWPTESLEKRLYLYHALTKTLLGSEQTGTSGLENAIQTLVYNSIIKTSQLSGTAISGFSLYILYWIYQFQHGYKNIYDYFPPTDKQLPSWCRPTNQALTFFINRYLWESYILPLMGALFTGLIMKIGRSYADQYVGNNTFIKEVRELIRSELSHQLFTAKELLGFENGMPTDMDLTTSAPYKTFQQLAEAIAQCVVAQFIKTQSIKNVRTITALNKLIDNPTSFLSISTFHPEPTGLPTFVNILKLGDLAIDKRYPRSQMEFLLSNLIPLGVGLMVYLVTYAIKVPPEWLMLIYLPLIIALYMNTCHRTKKQPLYASTETEYTISHQLAQRFHREFNEFSAQITTAHYESELPAVDDLKHFIKTVHTWLAQEQTTIKQIRLRGLIKQLNVDNLLIQRDQVLRKFCNIESRDLNITIRDGLRDSDTIEEFFNEAKDSIYSETEYMTKYPTIHRYMIHFCEQMGRLQSITIDDEPLLMSEQIQTTIGTQLSSIKTTIINAISLDQLSSTLAGNNAIQILIGQPFITHPILCYLMIQQSFLDHPVGPESIVNTANACINNLYAEAVKRIVINMIPSRCSRFVQRNLRNHIPTGWCGFFGYSDYRTTKQTLRRTIDNLPNEGIMVDTKRELIAYLDKKLPDLQLIETNVRQLHRV